MLITFSSADSTSCLLNLTKHGLQLYRNKAQEYYGAPKWYIIVRPNIMAEIKYLD